MMLYLVINKASDYTLSSMVDEWDNNETYLEYIVDSGNCHGGKLIEAWLSAIFVEQNEHRVPEVLIWNRCWDQRSAFIIGVTGRLTWSNACRTGTKSRTSRQDSLALKNKCVELWWRHQCVRVELSTFKTLFEPSWIPWLLPWLKKVLWVVI